MQQRTFGTGAPISTTSVNIRYTRGLVMALQMLGYPVPGVMVEIEATAGESGRGSVELQNQFWAETIATCDDPLLGLRMGALMEFGHLDVIGYLLLSCDSLEQGLELLESYFPIIGGGGRIELQLPDNLCRIVYKHSFVLGGEQRTGVVMALMAKFGRQLQGAEFGITEVTLVQPGDTTLTAKASELLGCPVRMGQKENSFCFSAELLKRPVCQSHPLVKQQVRTVADQALKQLGTVGLQGQVQKLLADHLHWGREQVADALHLSPRHLSRRLSAEGCSFKQLQEQSRCQVAMEKLCNSSLTSKQLAELLGFNDESAFARAFRRWTGHSPREYRCVRCDNA
ncbi:AraC family transcriptional regulator [Parendozoicomonas haliclonae]|uniref:HTH-type transcriptional regulator VirS n=1 Tax=Parendozoicomonas haliclonae TaxID=1960125 RepID=A0A1X7AP10_9GAMM|nr:AraC family transcriptional regulator [Parendozoicomonas haliclonae]SMA49830.1 HTH-type transcriptional regulator VirS [Parendozoicomonas haliclonae]